MGHGFNTKLVSEELKESFGLKYDDQTSMAMSPKQRTCKQWAWLGDSLFQYMISKYIYKQQNHDENVGVRDYSLSRSLYVGNTEMAAYIKHHKEIYRRITHEFIPSVHNLGTCFEALLFLSQKHLSEKELLKVIEKYIEFTNSNYVKIAGKGKKKHVKKTHSSDEESDRKNVKKRKLEEESEEDEDNDVESSTVVEPTDLSEEEVIHYLDDFFRAL
ncbi:dcr1 [Acrasis kona]|uniref:Dcr1 n=1 Tax=Acrasis kona TaxID=1008807 RepID=A0AAW2YH34_9EUKA